jgi:hypothetical protein
MAGGGMWPNGFTDNTFAFFRAGTGAPPLQITDFGRFIVFAEGIVEETGFLARGKTVADESGLRVTLENLNNWFVA